MTSTTDLSDSPDSTDQANPLALPPEFASAFAAKGYSSLSMVQEAVLAPELAGRDLRISSQTGSGKTIAIGFTMRDILQGEQEPGRGPRGLVVAPTRELAKQVEEELGWLFAATGAKVVSLVGGTSVRDERRALSMNPTIVVGTPGRLLDHQRKGALRTDSIHTVVLDEADRMLDMGFREDIEALFAALPAERRTHLVSATFPREVKALAARIQKDFAQVEGTPLGAANADIEHIIHLCHSTERLNAVVNLLLKARLEETVEPGRIPDATLIFARTRADVADVSRELQKAGFRVGALSGELEQAARNRALEAFKTGQLDALVATDVAARGIDSQNVARVIHGDPPADPDTYTHRSGRTGRAGRKGQSILLVVPVALERVTRLLQRAKVTPRIEPLPSKEDLLDAQDARWYADLTDEYSEQVPDERTWNLSKRIVREGDVTRAIARLLHQAQTSGGKTRPRDIAPVGQPRGYRPGPNDRFETRLPRPTRTDGPRFADRSDAPRFENPRFAGRDENPRFAGREDGPRNEGPRFAGRDDALRFGGRPERPAQSQDAGDWVTFHVSWGETHGADPRRLVAMACRRGGIQGSDIGAIRVGRSSSTIDVSSQVARDFGTAVAKPDPRDPRIAFGRSPGTMPPPEAPQTLEIPTPRPSRPRASKIEPDRPSRPVAMRAERPSKPTPLERPSKPAAVERPSKPAAVERPSKPAAVERPSKPAKRPEPIDAPKPYPSKSKSEPGDKPYPSKGKPPFAGKPPYENKGGKPPFAGKSAGKPPYENKGGKPPFAGKPAKPAPPAGDDQPPRRRRDIKQ